MPLVEGKLYLFAWCFALAKKVTFSFCLLLLDWTTVGILLGHRASCIKETLFNSADGVGKLTEAIEGRTVFTRIHV